MEKLFEQFLKERRYLHNLQESTLGFYKQVYGFFNEVGAFNELSKETLQNSILAFRERKTSIGAINTYIRGINTFLKWLHTEHDYPNLCIKFLKCQKTVLKALTDEELTTIIKYKPKSFSQKRMHILLLTLLDTGIRITEALTLERSKVDFDNLLLTIKGKGNKERVVPFSFELRKILYKFIESHEFVLVFSSVNGTKLHYDNALRDFYVLCRKLKLNPDAAFHCMRRTYSTNFIRQGGNPFSLMRILGHTTMEMTQRYVKLVTDDLSDQQHKTSLLNRLR